MRPLHAALVLAIVAATGTSYANQPKPKKVKPTNTSAPSKKVARSTAPPAATPLPPPPAPTLVPAPTPSSAPTVAPKVALEPDPAPAPDAARPPATATGPASTAAFAASSPTNGSVDRDRASDDLDGPPKPMSIAPLFGIGSNQLKLGAGLRAGYTLPANVYLGAAFMYHFGTSAESFGVKVSTSAFYPSAEVGYDFHAGRHLIVRPYGGLAAIFATATVSALGQEKSVHETAAGVYPGCMLTYNIPSSSFFVGGDARYLLVVDGGGSSLGLFASGGMKF